jgi:hypothetical protein
LAGLSGRPKTKQSAQSKRPRVIRSDVQTWNSPQGLQVGGIVQQGASCCLTDIPSVRDRGVLVWGTILVVTGRSRLVLLALFALPIRSSVSAMRCSDSASAHRLASSTRSTDSIFRKALVNLELELLDHPESILEPEPRQRARAIWEPADKL